VAGSGRFAASEGRPDIEAASFGPERRLVFRISGPGWRFAVRKNQRGTVLMDSAKVLLSVSNVCMLFGNGSIQSARRIVERESDGE